MDRRSYSAKCAKYDFRLTKAYGEEYFYIEPGLSVKVYNALLPFELRDRLRKFDFLDANLDVVLLALHGYILGRMLR